MGTFAIDNARILTLSGHDGPRRGDAMRDLGVLERGHVVIDGDTIEAVGSGEAPAIDGATRIDAGGRVVMPSYVDPHTHACWSGERFDEYEMKLAGASYLEILESGGGIMSTVRAVRSASEDELVERLLVNVARMAALGTGVVEVKSGYGLNTAAELKMLRAIRAAAGRTPLTLVPTFLGAHAIDAENPAFIEQTIQETLPAVVAEFGPITCDAYCEQGAWSVDDTVRLFEAARDLDCPLRIHTDQFNSLGMTARAIDMGAVSVDHLEATVPGDLPRLAASDTFAVALPASGFHLDDRYADGRGLIDAGCALALATNDNPGSAPTPSIPLVIALACRKLGLMPAEAISAVTWNAACLLGLVDHVGSLDPGKRANLQVLDMTDERELGYELGGPGPALAIVNGQVVGSRAPFASVPIHS